MNDPTDTLPTSPIVPPTPTRMLLPDTAPATLNDLSAGTLGASPVPAMVRLDRKSPGMAAAVLVFALPFTVIDPTLGALIDPLPTEMAVSAFIGPATSMSVSSATVPRVIDVPFFGSGLAPVLMSAPLLTLANDIAPTKPLIKIPGPFAPSRSNLAALSELRPGPVTPDR